jgi:hypothetical protein
MAISKTRTNSRASRSRRTSLDIRCRINSLPVKALLFALSYVIAKADETEKPIGRIEISKARRVVKSLGGAATMLKTNEELDPEEVYSMINAACSSYINLYYSLDSGVKRSILEEHKKKGKISFEENMLTMPAITSMRNEPKNEVILTLRKSLYKKPFIFLHSAISNSRKIESLRIAMALNESKDDGMKMLSYSLMSIEKALGNIEKGIMNPAQDEAFKVEVINGLAGLSEQYDIHTLSYITGKLDEATFNIKSAQRVVRQ